MKKIDFRRSTLERGLEWRAVTNIIKDIWNKNHLMSLFQFYFILPDLYMFRAHRPILRRVHTAVHTTTGSVSVLL